MNSLNAAAMIWLAASQEGISLLELSSMQVMASYSYLQVLTFGGCQDDFMLVINTDDGMRSQKLLFALSKPKVFYRCFSRDLYGLLCPILSGSLNYRLTCPDSRIDTHNSGLYECVGTSWYSHRRNPES